MLVPMCSTLKRAFEFFLSLLGLPAKTASALCWGTVAKHFEVIETERAFSRFQEIYVGANVLNFGKRSFFEFFLSLFRFTSKTATALYWGTASK